MNNEIVILEVKKIAGLGYKFEVMDGMDDRMYLCNGYYKTYNDAGNSGIDFCNTRNYFVSNLVNGQLL